MFSIRTKKYETKFVDLTVINRLSKKQIKLQDRIPSSDKHFSRYLINHISKHVTQTSADKNLSNGSSLSIFCKIDEELYNGPFEQKSIVAKGREYS